MAGEQGWIKVSQQTQRGRYRQMLFQGVISATAVRQSFVAPADMWIRSITHYQNVVAVGGPTAINIGNVGTAAAYGTVAVSATQAADTSVAGTVTGTFIPKGQVVLVASAAGTSGGYSVTMEYEFLETDQA